MEVFNMKKYTVQFLIAFMILLFFIGNADEYPYIPIVGIITLLIYVVYTEIAAHIFRKLKNNVIRNLLIITFWYLYVALIGFLFSAEGMILAVVLVLIMFIAKLYSASKEKNDKKLLEQKFGLNDNSKNIEINDPMFNDKIFKIYKDLQNVYMNNNLDSIKDIVTEEIYINHQKEIEKLKQNNLRKITDNLNLINSKIISIYNMFEEEIEVLLEVTFNQYYINELTKEIVGGDESLLHNEIYQLTFIRKRENICPNCNSKLDKNIDVCPICHNRITYENSMYILAKEQTVYKNSKY